MTTTSNSVYPLPDSEPLVLKEQDIEVAFTQRLEPLRDKRFVFIFDECHRSQFGDNHQAIKEFFLNSQLFGFTGTPIFEANATGTKIENQQASLQTTADLFQKQLHPNTIPHAIRSQLQHAA